MEEIIVKLSFEIGYFLISKYFEDRCITLHLVQFYDSIFQKEYTLCFYTIDKFIRYYIYLY